MEKAQLQSYVSGIAKGAGIVFFGAVISRILIYTYTVILAKNVGTELLGIYFLGLTITNIIFLLSTIGLNYAAVRYVALFRGEKNTRAVNGTIKFASEVVLLVAVILAVFTFFSADLISVRVFKKPELGTVLRLFSLTIPFSAITFVFLGAIQGFRRMKELVMSRDLFIPSVRMVSALIFFFFGWKLYGVVFAYLVSAVLGVFFAFGFLARVSGAFFRQKDYAIDRKGMLKFSAPLFLASILNTIMFQVNILLLGILIEDASAISVFMVAFRTALLGSFFLLALSTTFGPVISDLYNRKEKEALQTLLKVVARWAFLLSFPFYLGLMIFARPVLGLIGKDFLIGQRCLIILCLGDLFSSSFGPMGVTLTMSGKTFLNLINNIVTCGLNIILSLLLIPRWGILGAAWAAAVALASANLLRLLEVSLILKLPPFKLSYLKPLFAGIISFMLLAALAKYNAGLLLSTRFFPFSVSLFLGVYFFLLWKFRLDEEDLVVLRAVKRKILAAF